MDQHELIPDLPEWFKNYLTSLTVSQKDELFQWINSGDDAAVLETLQEAIS